MDPIVKLVHPQKSLALDLKTIETTQVQPFAQVQSRISEQDSWERLTNSGTRIDLTSPLPFHTEVGSGEQVAQCTWFPIQLFLQ